MVFLTGCSGFSRLPEINFVGRNREEVVRYNPLNCDNNIYFYTAADALADEQIQNALAIGGYRTARLMAVPGGWDYYEVVFDKNNIAISQKISTQFDGP